MCEFVGCDYCILLTVKVLCHVEVTIIQLLNLLKGTMSIYSVCLLSPSSHKII